MKNILKKLTLLAVFPAIMLSSPNSLTPPRFTVKATITDISDVVEVNVTEGEYASGLYWILTDENTIILDKNGIKITKDALSVGDEVKIVYNGQVMMSYPAKIYALSITVI
jgi:hypothetical protein